MKAAPGAFEQEAARPQRPTKDRAAPEKKSWEYVFFWIKGRSFRASKPPKHLRIFYEIGPSSLLLLISLRYFFHICNVYIFCHKKDENKSQLSATQ